MDRVQAKFWCITVNNPEGMINFDEMPEWVEYFIYGEEFGEEEGTFHFQCFMIAKKLVRMSAIKKIPGLEKAHVDRRYDYSTNEQAREYCKKEGIYHEYGHFREQEKGARNDLKTITTSIKEKGYKRTIEEHPEAYLRFGKKLKELDEMLHPPKVPEVQIELRKWQQDIIAWLETPIKEREIVWIWSNSSGKGKSTFCKYICSKYDVLLGSMEMKRTLYAYDRQNVIWFDIPRQRPLDAEFTSQLEALANQTIHLSEMFQPVQKYVNAKIIVTCNRPPPHDKLPGRLCEFDLDKL